MQRSCSTITNGDAMPWGMNNTASFNVAKVQKRSTELKAADALRDAIISGAIPLGARLTEISLAEQLDVSRSTIRTALHQLVQEGLVIQVPYTGWTVMTLSATDAWELYTLRASLEALAARLVAEKVQDKELANRIHPVLSAAFERLTEACKRGGKELIALEDLNLHKAIVDLSEHVRLIDQYSRIQYQIQLYIQSSDALISDSKKIISQHKPIIESLLRGDVEAAVTAAIAHNESEGALLVEHISGKDSREA